ncbi:ArnT family glycosyltransferase [Phenylobacterium montanum]|uniref:Glycosyltransferase family 39 protein n=1 Tax=Phenylobacterium montanum TaxID=2823693 RepID=A0A975ITY8_9CAUL|nr:glycosyltransferase family 39 protein [Caulobacter sp. S6]QUD87210.1 glycosyltransferase family 39 protein [Caulobacter sp. S6]
MTATATPAARFRPGLSLLLILGAITALRLLAAAFIPLTEDEAYYRLWALHPAFGYYDHPPMVAWWIHAGMALAGDTPLGVRLIPCLSCLATSLMAFDLAAQLSWDEATAGRAAVWCNATLLIGAGGLLAIPDAASTPFWTLTLCCLARTRGPGAPGWWVAAGAAAGLACLSKYSALFLAPGAVLWLLLQPGGLASLKKPWPWLAALVAAAIFSLNLAWNAEHHWVSFAKQFGRAAPGRFDPRFELELMAGQFLLLNPFVAVFALRALPRWRSRDGGDLSLPLLTTAPFAAYLLLHALHDRVQAHWPVPVYPALALAAAAMASGPQGGGWRVVRALAAPFGLGLAALGLAHAALPQTDLKKGDPAVQLRDWPGFAARIEASRRAAGAAWVGTLSYGVTSQLLAQRAIQAPVVELIERDRYAMDHDAPRPDLARPGLVVDLERRVSPAALSACFTFVRPIGPALRDGGRSHESRYQMALVSGPRVDAIGQGCRVGG